MKYRIMIAMSAVSLASIAVLASLVAGKRDKGESNTQLAEVPAVVRAAIKKATKGVKVKEIEKETDDGKTVYEVEVSKNRVEIELVFNENGSLVAFDVEGDEEDDAGDENDDERSGNRSPRKPRCWPSQPNCFPSGNRPKERPPLGCVTRPRTATPPHPFSPPHRPRPFRLPSGTTPAQQHLWPMPLGPPLGVSTRRGLCLIGAVVPAVVLVCL